jgi:hypothetical protein
MSTDKKGGQLFFLMISVPILFVIGIIGGRFLSQNFEHYDGAFACTHWLFLAVFWIWNLFVIVGGGDPGTTDMSDWKGYGGDLFEGSSSDTSTRAASGESDPDAFDGPGDGD